jgi:PAS domain S-box-containing protein
MPQTGKTAGPHYAGLEAACGSGVYEWRPAEDRLVWSPGLVQLYGLTQPPTAEGGFTQLVHPEDRVRVEAEISTYLGSELKSFSHSFRIVRPDGAIRFILDRGFIERDETGIVRAIRGINVDLTDFPSLDKPSMIEQCESCDLVHWLSESEARLTLFIEHAPAAIAMFDRDMRYLAASRRWRLDYRLTGELPGRSHYEIFPEIPELWKEAHRRGLAGESLHSEGDWFERANGSDQWVKWDILPWRTFDGEVGGIIIATEDITARKQDEVRLRESRAKLQAAFASMTEAVFIADTEGRLIDFNDAYIRYHRFRDREECRRTIGDWRAYLDVWLADGAPAPFEQWAMPRALRGETASHVEYRLRRKDTGETWWGSYNFAPIKDQDGTIIGGVVAGRDITGRKAAEERLRESEARFRATFENAAVGVAHIAPDGAFARVNKRLCEIIDYSAAELVGRRFQDITHPDDLPADEAALQQFAAREIDSTVLEKRYLRKGGAPVWVRLTVSAERKAGGALDYFICIYEDISERKRAEEELRLTTERFQFAIQNSPIAVFNQDLDLRYTWIFNPALGYKASEVIGKFDSDLFERAEDAAALEAFKREVMRNGAGGRREILIRAAGVDRYYDLSAEPLRDAGGKIIGVTCAACDITERKQAEAAQRENTERLTAVLEAQREIARASLSYDGLLQTILERMSRLLAADGACLEIADGDDLVYEAATGLASGFVGLRVDVRASLSGLSMTSNTILRADDAESDPRVNGEACRRLGLRSLILMPLRYGERSFGVLKLMSAHPAAFTARGAEQTLRLMQEFLGVTIGRQRAQAALQESEEQFRTLADAIPQLAWIARADGSRYWYNRRWYEYTGTTGQQMESRGWQSVHDPGTLPAVQERWRESMATGEPFDMIHPLRGADGVFRRFLTRVQPLKNAQGQVVRWFGTNTDVDELKRAEEALRASEDRYRGIFQNAGTGIAIGDLGGQFQSCNPAFAAMLGYTEEELRNLVFANLVHPEDREANMATIQRLVSEEIPSFEIYNRFVRKDGATLWVHKHVSLLRDAAGRPSSIIALVTDMSERKRHEEHTQLLMREVNHRSKNILSLVQAIAHLTASNGPQDFVQRFGERIRSLSAAQNLLLKHEWKAVPLADLVRSQLSHFADLVGERISLSGPPLFITPSASQALGMALHELATNAAKYGALSAETGRVAIAWGVYLNGGVGPRFTMSWVESGGPPVAPPQRRGFGSTVTSTMVEGSVGGKVSVDYAPAGLQWRLVCADDIVVR